MHAEAQYWRRVWVSLKSIFLMKHVSAPRHPGASKFILGQRMLKLAITEPTNAAIYTEPCTSVFCFIGLLEISQASGYIWKASSPFHRDVKVVFRGLTCLEWIWSSQLDCMSKILSPLFQWNAGYVLKMVAASRSTYPTHLERTLYSWYLCWLACMLVLNVSCLDLLDHFSDSGLNIQMFVKYSQKWDTEAYNVSKSMILLGNTLLHLVSACLFCLHCYFWSCTCISPCDSNTFSGLFWCTVL